MEIHANAKKMGDVRGANKSTRLRASVKIIERVKALKGTFKTKKSISQLSKEID